jgi:hypothetical protein
MLPNDYPENAQFFHCDICDYVCSRRFLLKQHESTRKHIFAKERYKMATKIKKNMQTHECSCGNIYRHKSSFFRHKKTCKICKKYAPGLLTDVELKEDEKIPDDKLIDILKQNQEFQKMLVEQNRQIMELSRQQTVIHNNNNLNCNNTIHNRFNLNVFLNEKCKDALNISEFVNSLEITFSDLENVGSSGFVDGISRILIQGLKELDVCKRPIHCSDLKREIMHVKENNVWEKEDESRPKLIEAIKTIADKNIKTIPEWKQVNPECRNSASKKSDQYLQIMGHALGACDKVKDNENYQKIIKKVAKEVVIDKTIL